MPALQNPKHERFYVYALVDSRDGNPFYIGKGCRKRCNAHMRNWRSGKEKNPKKSRRISEIIDAGSAVVVAILASGLSETAALKLERETIREIGIKNLTNIQPGTFSDIERAALQAKDALRHIMPFKQWASIRPRSQADIELYRSIVRDFREFAAQAA